VVDSVARSVVGTAVHFPRRKQGCTSRAGRNPEEDTMQPDIAYHVVCQRCAELIAEAAHQRLVHETRQIRTDPGGYLANRRTS
jgi:hypothetical protein